MIALRKVIFWLHLTAGLAAGAIILVMCVTGTLLAFERQIVDFAERDLRAATPAGERLATEALLAKVRATRGGAPPSGVTLRADPAAPVMLNFGREGALFVQPATGAILGEGAKGLRQFFHTVTGLHRWLAASEEMRAVGKSITGAANLAFLFLVLSGLVLWWPRQWRPSALQAAMRFDGRLRGKARDWNWHNVLGFWCAVPLFFIVLTGVLISYPWATNLLYRLTGNEPPPVRAASPGGMRGAAVAAEWKLDGLDAITARAAQEIPTWRTMTLRLPATKTATVMIEESHRGRPDLKTTLTLDAKTAEVTQREGFAQQNRARQWRLWGRWIHTGEAGGWPGQLLAGIATAGGAVLVWTGFALSWRRFFARKPRPAAAGAGAEVVAGGR